MLWFHKKLIPIVFNKKNQNFFRQFIFIDQSVKYMKKKQNTKEKNKQYRSNMHGPALVAF
jgi:hypothetical protein